MSSVASFLGSLTVNDKVVVVRRFEVPEVIFAAHVLLDAHLATSSSTRKMLLTQDGYEQLVHLLDVQGFIGHEVHPNSSWSDMVISACAPHEWSSAMQGEQAFHQSGSMDPLYPHRDTENYWGRFTLYEHRTSFDN